MKPFERLVGTWSTEGSHPALPGEVIRGKTVFEWMSGGKFLIQRARADDPRFPEATMIIGDTASDRVADAGDATGAPGGEADTPLQLYYFDSRGVFRTYDVTIDDHEWRFWRVAPGFSQRFTGKFADRGNTIVGLSELNRDDKRWERDLELTYRRER